MKKIYRLYTPEKIRKGLDGHIFVLRETEYGNFDTVEEAEAFIINDLEKYSNTIILPVYIKN